MNMKLDASVVLALVFCGFASLANATEVLAPGVYTPEYTNAWFSVAANDMPSSTSGNWVVPEGCATVVNSQIDLDTDVNKPLTYTPAAATITNVTRIATTLKVTQSSDLPDVSGAKTALCVCTNAAGDVAWFAYADAKWNELTKAGTPTVDSEYEIVLDSDSVNGKIRYLAKTSGGGYNELTDGWIQNPASQNSHIEKVAFAGSTTLGDFAGVDAAQGYEYNNVVYKSLDEAASAAATAGVAGDITFPVTADDGQINANIDASWINEKIAGDDKLASLNGQGSNGLKRWQSYVLNLDPNVEASKPIVQPVQNVAGDKVAFSLDVNTASGVPVTYVVKAYSSLSAVEATCTSARATAGSGSVEMALPSSGVLYYKMEDIQFGNNP